jgi:hypothetical protein
MAEPLGPPPADRPTSLAAGARMVADDEVSPALSASVSSMERPSVSTAQDRHSRVVSDFRDLREKLVVLSD